MHAGVIMKWEVLSPTKPEPFSPTLQSHQACYADIPFSHAHMKKKHFVDELVDKQDQSDLYRLQFRTATTIGCSQHEESASASQELRHS